MIDSASRPSDPLVVRGLTVRYGRALALDDVSLAVPRGAVYVLLGRSGAGKTSLVRCLLGALKPSSGEALLFGKKGWWTRRRALARIGVVQPEQAGRIRLASAHASQPEALVFDEPASGLPPGVRRAILEELSADAAERHTAVLLATRDPAGLDGFATHVGILNAGRLVVASEAETLRRRFRRIRYANEITDERTEYGRELDAFDAVRVKVRGWGVEAVVSNFDDEVFAAFAATAGVVDARAEALTLEEIFGAAAGEAPPIVAPER